MESVVNEECCVIWMVMESVVLECCVDMKGVSMESVLMKCCVLSGVIPLLYIVYGLVHLSCYVQGKYIVYYIMCGCSGVRVTMCDSDNQEPLV